MSTHDTATDEAPAEKGPRRVRPYQLAIGIGIFMGLFTVVSGILPQITKWHTDKFPSREAFDGIPGPLIDRMEVFSDSRPIERTPVNIHEVLERVRKVAQSGFARVHRAYLVNLTHAVELRAQLNGTAVLIMRDGTEVPVARRNVAALRRRLHA